MQLTPYLISTLLEISQRPNIEALCEDETFQDIIVEAIDTLVLFTGEKEFYDYIVAFNRPVLVNVSLTLLRTTKSEVEQMIKDPESFVNLALDTCDKQKSKVVKT
jgi:hypothetical protein